jgi:hypothetical protein
LIANIVVGAIPPNEALASRIVLFSGGNIISFVYLFTDREAK